MSELSACAAETSVVAGAPRPADLAEELPHVGGRVVAPAVLGEQRAGQVPVQAVGGRRAAVLDLEHRAEALLP